MSVRTMARVWDGSEHSGTHLLMLLAIADFADDDGNAYPSVPTLAGKCRMKPRNANVILAALRKSGELQVRPNEGPRGTNLYRIVVSHKGVQERAGCKDVQGVKACTLQAIAANPAKACSKPLQRLADEPSLNRQEPPSRTRASKPRGPVASELLSEVEPQVLADWLVVRKAKRVGSVTPTAAKLLKSEATKAGLSVQQAVETCVARGWASFKAAWNDGDRGAFGQAVGSAKRSVLNADEVLTGAA